MPTSARTLKLLLVSLLALALAGCPHLLALGRVGAAGPGGSDVKTSISGIVDLAELYGQARRVQGSIGEIADGSTVSLINATTGETAASTVTQPDGSFSLTFSGFIPTGGTTYYLEAVKGLSAGGAPNRAGASGARLRTVVRFSADTWQTLTAGKIDINSTSTALSIICSLRSYDASQFIGTVNPSSQDGAGADSFSPPTGSPISVATLDQVYDLVNEALAVNQDPVFVISYNQFSSTYFITAAASSLGAVVPAAAPIGETITISGQNFDADPTYDKIYFNGAQAASYSVNTSGTTILATVPVGATSGEIIVQVGPVSYSWPFFRVLPWDGHTPFDQNLALYVAGTANNTVWQVSKGGTPAMVATDLTSAPPGSSAQLALNAGLNQPEGVVVDASGDVYVANFGANTITELATGSVWTPTTFLSGNGLNQPWGLSIDLSGNLYVANSGAQNILKVVPGTTPTVTTYATGFTGNPSAMAFDQFGNLYVTTPSNGDIWQVPAGGGAASLWNGNLSGSGASSLAFDSSGNLFVATGKSGVYELPSGGQLTLVASIAGQGLTADSIAMRSDGEMVVGFENSNSLFLLNRSGGISPYLQAPRNVWSMAEDAAGDLFYGTMAFKEWQHRFYNPSLNDYNIYETPYLGSGFYGPFKILATGFNNVLGLAVNPVDGQLYAADVNNNIYRINPSTGQTQIYASSVPGWHISQMAFDSSGNLWMANWRSTWQTYELTAGGALDSYWSGRRPWGVAYDPTNSSYYVGMQEEGFLIRVSGNTPTATCSLEVTSGISNPQGMAYNAGDGDIYIASANNHLYRYVPSNNSVTDITAGNADLNNPYTMLATGNQLFVSNFGSNTITSYDAGSGTPVATISLPAGNNPTGLAVDTAGDLYAATMQGAVYEITTPTGTPGLPTSYATMSIAMPQRSGLMHLWGIAFDGSGNLYGALGGSNGRFRRTALYEIASGENLTAQCCANAKAWPLRADGRQMIFDGTSLVTGMTETRGGSGPQGSVVPGLLDSVVTSTYTQQGIGAHLNRAYGIQAGPVVNGTQTILQMDGPQPASLYPIQILTTSPLLTWRNFPDASANASVFSRAMVETFTWDPRGGSGNGTFLFGQLARTHDSCCGLGLADGAAGAFTDMYSDAGYSETGLFDPNGDLYLASIWGGAGNAPLQEFPGALSNPTTANSGGAQVPLNWPYEPAF